MFYLGLVTMKEMSPKQWAKARGTHCGHGADPVWVLKSSQRSTVAFLGLASDPMGIFSAQAGLELEL